MVLAHPPTLLTMMSQRPAISLTRHTHGRVGNRLQPLRLRIQHMRQHRRLPRLLCQLAAVRCHNHALHHRDHLSPLDLADALGDDLDERLGGGLEQPLHGRDFVLVCTPYYLLDATVLQLKKHRHLQPGVRNQVILAEPRWLLEDLHRLRVR